MSAAGKGEQGRKALLVPTLNDTGDVFFVADTSNPIRSVGYRFCYGLRYSEPGSNLCF